MTASTPRSPRGFAARRRKRRRRVRLCFLALALCAAGLLWLNRPQARARPYAPHTLTASEPAAAGGFQLQNSAAGNWDEDTRAALAALAQTEPRVQAMLDDPASWPGEVAALLARNPEALEFVLAYPTLSPEGAPAALEGIQRGVFPALLQWDARWGKMPYGGSVMALSGCGPTALSIVACGLTGDASYTPAAVARWADESGYAGEGGTSWELMSAGCEHFGLRAQELSLTENAVLGALEAGQPIICSMRPGDFTTVGHFIVLTGVENGKLRVLDPNSPNRSAALWDYQRLAPQIKNLWSYTAR